jgi:hypothetical protein
MENSISTDDIKIAAFEALIDLVLGTGLRTLVIISNRF